MTFVLGSKRDFLDYQDEEAMEFLEDVCDIVAIPEYQKLKQFRHHYSTNRYQHCLNVAWYTFLWCRRAGLNARSAARGAMLHDFFLYDWRQKETQPIPGHHAAVHPVAALANAEKYVEVDDVMRDCILHHMWPSAKGRPVTAEGLLVSLADKYCAGMELSMHTVQTVPPAIMNTIQRISR
ncbi:MAG: HD domain-containing protein [Solobacterium sp.]|nr:HD domain-containing protein [Solobacterium sp.]MBQ1356295.1 HD domain-containing protein [Solobacterium sp.]